MRENKKSFTLVEMLVVIGIIGVLASLLIGSVVLARRKARKVECLNNQRQVYTGLLSSTLDNNGQFPPYFKLGDTTAIPPIPDKPWTQILVDKKYTYGNVMVCPNSKNQFKKQIINEQELAKVDFGYNWWWIGSSNGLAAVPSPLEDPPEPAYMSDIKHPSATILIADTVNAQKPSEGSSILFPCWEVLGAPTQTDGRLENRHDGVNVTWADGHGTTEQTDVTGTPYNNDPFRKGDLQQIPFPAPAEYNTFHNGDPDNHWDRK